MWLIAEYRPVALFSLRMSDATSTGAKSVLLPTPFSIRTALLDAAIRTRGVDFGPEAFRLIRGLRLAVRPPERAVVTNLFSKVLKPQRADSGREGSMQKTISFREYVFLDGEMDLAFGGDEASLDVVKELLPQVTYFGKRGSFFQLAGLPQLTEELPDDFVPLDGAYVTEGRVEGESPEGVRPGTVQVMDDWGESLSFSKVNVFEDEDIKLGKDRLKKLIVLPYRPVRYSRGFTFYEVP